MTYKEYNKMTLRILKGRRVRARVQLINRGGDSVMAGTLGVITDKYQSLRITFDKCKHCGTVLHIKGVRPEEIELLPLESPAPGGKGE